MIVYLHRNFKKQYRALSNAQKKRFKERRNLFLKDPFRPLLHNHPLLGKHKEFRSINITGDLRVIYEPLKNNVALFIAIGTHSALYE